MDTVYSWDDDKDICSETSNTVTKYFLSDGITQVGTEISDADVKTKLPWVCCFEGIEGEIPPNEELLKACVLTIDEYRV